MDQGIGGRRIVRLGDATDRLGICRQTVYKWVRAGRLPKPVRLSRNAVGFIEQELDAFIASSPRVEYRARPKKPGAR